MLGYSIPIWLIPKYRYTEFYHVFLNAEDTLHIYKLYP